MRPVGLILLTTAIAGIGACSVEAPTRIPPSARRDEVPPCNNEIAIIPCNPPPTYGQITPPPDTVFLTYCLSDFFEPYHDRSLEYRMRFRNPDLSTSNPASVYDVYCAPSDYTYFYPNLPGPEMNVPIYYLKRPHENTHEAFELEMYDKRADWTVDRMFSAFWYWDYNGFDQSWSKDDKVCSLGQCPLLVDCNLCSTVTSRTTVGVHWTPVSYPTASLTLDPASLDLPAGSSAVVTTHALAPNGVEIFNQSTTPWQSTNTGVAYATPSAGYQVGSSFGTRWRNVLDTIVASAAGVATISTSINGQRASLPVTVRPTSLINGPTYVGTIGFTTWTASPTGCYGSCTYQWSVTWYDPTLGQYRTATLGTGQSQTLYVSPSYYGSFTLAVTPSSNGVTGIKGTLRVSNGTYHVGPGGGGCGTKLIC